MRIRLLLPLLLAFTAAKAQNPLVQSVIDAVSIDSMIQWVNEISGEVPVDVGQGPELILSRHKFNPGNAVAQAYLEQKLVQFGYTPQQQVFSATGVNVLAVKEGLVYPDEFYILCAHYDAMPGGILDAPAADDDGSGCAAVLEAARILRDFEFEYTIVFALWDEEEQGLIGSKFYAGGMAANNAPIRGVVNMDAIAYDGNGDTKARIHTRPIANSIELSDSVFSIRAAHNIDLDLILTNPGATYSDHAAFWTEGYGAILVIEEFGADGNPYYHTPEDRVIHFDVPYYEKLAKLSIATLTALAVPIAGPQSVNGPLQDAPVELAVFPNPADDQASLIVDVQEEGAYQVEVVDAMGRHMALVHAGFLPQGRHTFRIPVTQWAAGSYIVTMRAPNGTQRSLRLVRRP
jgi:hypothetical protein